ncbi:MAG TPA: GNAT family N-acetyltransferase [Anaerolineae bacterium]|nr:GNAT family N-acetyltransferase [Anaerolineae bacterium]HOR00311.1 GNAT family N-acetyltransferase [Anaerolineae bacterium]HPL28601.1 GNAT family N-acetyltransferase [Anaerolineae bacterium]
MAGWPQPPVDWRERACAELEMTFSTIMHPDGYVLRAARAEDRDAVAALCAHAWSHGEDYVPGAWDAWLVDAQGALLVVERGAEPVAVAKVTMLAPHEGWLEGLRVDPAHRGRGLAGWILGICLARAHALGATVARLGTGAKNVAVHKTAARHGMARVAGFLYYEAPSLAEAAQPAALAATDLAQAQDLLRDCEALRASAGLYETYWCWPELTAERLATALAGGRVYGAHDDAGRLAALAMVESERQAERTEDLALGLLAGEPAAVTGLARGLRGLAARRGLGHVESKLPELAPLRAAAQAAGFAADGDMEIVVFEKRWS